MSVFANFLRLVVLVSIQPVKQALWAHGESSEMRKWVRFEAWQSAEYLRFGS